MTQFTISHCIFGLSHDSVDHHTMARRPPQEPDVPVHEDENRPSALTLDDLSVEVTIYGDMVEMYIWYTYVHIVYMNMDENRPYMYGLGGKDSTAVAVDGLHVEVTIYGDMVYTIFQITEMCFGLIGPTISS